MWRCRRWASAPGAARHLAFVKKFHRFSGKNLWPTNEKSMKKFSPILLSLQGLRYMVCKTIGSISWVFLLKKIWKKKYSAARDICKTSEEKLLNKCNYLCIHCIYSDFFAIIFQHEWPWDWAGFFAHHKLYELNKIVDNFFMDFSFFTQRFFKENLWGYKELCTRSTKNKLIMGVDMASFAEC